MGILIEMKLREFYILAITVLIMAKKPSPNMRCPKCNQKSVIKPGKVRGQRFATCGNCGFKSPTHRGNDEWIYEDN
jgi:predicted RNA-binding Zn-ribbon protein involved in translation (DUF1610 family)